MHASVLSHFSHVRPFVISWTSPPGSSVHGILQARTLEWVAMPSSRQHPLDHHKDKRQARQLCPRQLALSSKTTLLDKEREFQKNTCFWFIDYAKTFDCVDHNKLWKILKEMGIQDHLTSLLRNLHAGQEATVKKGHGTMDWFQLRKDYIKAVYCHPAYLTYMQSTS